MQLPSRVSGRWQSEHGQQTRAKSMSRPFGAWQRCARGTHRAAVFSGPAGKTADSHISPSIWNGWIVYRVNFMIFKDIAICSGRRLFATAPAPSNWRFRSFGVRSLSLICWAILCTTKAHNCDSRYRFNTCWTQNHNNNNNNGAKS